MENSCDNVYIPSLAILSDNLADNENKLSINELLFPQLPDDYFKYNDCLQFDDRNPIEKAIDAYNNAPVKPYIKRSKLGGDGDPLDNEARKNCWEIGLEFKF